MERKQRRLLMVLAMALAVGMATSAAQADRVAWWKFDETSGTIAYDEEGYFGMNDGRLRADEGFDLPEWSPFIPPQLIGISTGSIYLPGDESGSNQVVDCGNNPALNFPPDQSFTAACWFYIDNWTGGSYAAIMVRGNSWRIYRYSTTDRLRYYTAAEGGFNGNTDVRDGAWHHVAFVYDSVPDIAYGYVDGAIDASETNYLGGGDYPGNTLYFGNRFEDYGSEIRGWIDDAAVWNEALSQQEVNLIMKNGVGAWKGGNTPPYAEAGPYYQVVIKEVYPTPTYFQLEGLADDHTIFEPNKLEYTWFQEEGTDTLPFLNHVSGLPDANDLNAIIDFTFITPDEYHIRLWVTDGDLDTNDIMIIDLKPEWYTGLTVWWAFEDNLLDELHPDNQGVEYNNLSKSNPGCLDEFYGPGVIGQAVYLGHTDYAGHFATMEAPDSPDFELARAFTIEAYVKPRFYNPLVDDRAQILSKWYIDHPEQFDWYFSYNCYLADNEYMTMTICNPRDTNVPPTVYYTGYLETDLAHAMFPATAEWQHLAWVSDGTNKTDFWIDGVLRDSYTWPIDEEYFEIKDQITPVRLADGIMYDYRVYEGWMDDIKIWHYNKPAKYLRERARLIPLQAPEPADEELHVQPYVILSWSQAKGYTDPKYNVYFAPEGQALALVAENCVPRVIETGGNPICYYDPCEAGNVPDLNYNTKYNWRVDVVGVPGAPITGPDWEFTTRAADYTAIVAQWKFNEGTGTVAHDSALPDDVGYYHYPGAGEILPPEWVPGWIDAEIGQTALLFRNFEYLDIDAADPNVFIDLVTDDFTISTWFIVIPEFLNPSEELVGKGYSYGLGRQGTSQNLEFYFNDVFAGDTLGGNKAVGDGIWHHAAAVYVAPTRATDGAGYLYIDGALDASEEVVGNWLKDDQNPLALAKNKYEAYDFNGALEETRIYKRAFSAQEVYALYDEGIKNLQPRVNTGINTVLEYPQTAITYETTIFDDNKPTGKSPVITWSQISGPGTMTFDPETIAQDAFPGGFVPDEDNVLITQMTFSEPGFYKARLHADDLTYSHYDEVRFWVQSEVKEPGMERVVAYWRFEEDDKETTYPKTPDGDDPNTLIIPNEVALAPPLISRHVETFNMPLLHTTVPVATVPLTGEANTKRLGEGVGDWNWYGERRGTTGMDTAVEAEVWDGLVFCEDGITVELYLTVGAWDDPIIDLNWTIFDTLFEGKGLEFRNVNQTDNRLGARDRLRFQFYVETDVPNYYQRVYVQSDVLVFREGWKHVAFTYEKETGIARVYENGIPAWITHYYDDNAGTWREYNPMVDHWQGVPGKTFAMSEKVSLASFELIDTPSGFDEFRITAEALFPPKLLVAGPGICEEKVVGDLDGDCDVDVVDLKMFSDSWLTCNNADPTQCFK